MKTRLKKLIVPTLALCTLLAGTARSYSQALATVDPTQTWVGYMSWSPVPGDAAGYGGSGGGVWGTADLQALFTGGMLVLSPNTNVYNPTSTYWVNADGSGANNMDASFYVQNDTLVGKNVTFTGTCANNTLVAGYTSQAFIKVFDGSFNLLGQIRSTLVTGQTFLIVQPAMPGAVHVQYGFETVGPDANPATASGLGQVTVAVPVGLKVQTDPNKFWAGYMNWQPVDPLSGFGGTGGNAWGTADLQANFSGTNLYLLPNTNVWNDTNPYWVNTTTGTGANLMDANFYVTDDSIVNTNVIFSGYCVSNTLVAGYTSQAFIKIFNSDYSTYLGGVFSANLIPGQSFIINLDTTGAAHVQYGFATDGADVNPTNQAATGQVIVAASVPVAPPPVLQIPTNNAPTPTQPSASVVAMYDSSGTYPNSPGIGWYATWGSVVSQGDYTITNTGAVVKKYTGLQYCGVEFYGNPINVSSGYDTFHIDVWTPNANQLGVKLVSLTAGTQDPQVNLSGITSNHWVGLDIPLSAFSAIQPAWDPSNLQQMLLVDNSSAGAGAQGGTFYVDNAYFYNSATNPKITAVISGGGLNLSFPTLNGSSYTVQYKTNLMDAVWQTLTNFTGDGSTPVITDPANQKSRFYRLFVQ